MRALSMLATFACLFTAAAATPCAAEPSAIEGADEAFAKQVFGKALDANEMRACFKRVYSAEHMKKHPQQNVRSLTVLLTGKLESDDFAQYGIAMAVAFRQDKRDFGSYGTCGLLEDAEGRPMSSTTAHCGIDCDGGFFTVAVKDAGSLVVTMTSGVRTWEVGHEDDEYTESDSERFGPDDREFRLVRTARSDCGALWSEDTTALQDAE